MLNWLIPASQRARALRREHAAVRDERDVLESHGSGDRGNQLLEIATQQWLASRERDEHRVEEAGCVGEAAQLIGLRRGRGLPVVAEAAARVAAERHLEVHEHRPSPRDEVSVFREEERDVPWLEARGQHDAARCRASMPVRSSGARRLRDAPSPARCRTPRRRGGRRRSPGRWSARARRAPARATSRRPR